MNSEQSVEETSELDLLRRIAEGDESAFSQLYDRLAPVLFQLAFRILKDAATAEDVLQEALLQIWDKASHYDPELGKPLAWAITLTRNKSIDRLRASQRRYRATEEAGLDQQVLNEHFPDATSSTILDETSSFVRVALEHLANDQRQAIELAFFSGLTQTQIAATLGLPLGTVKARIRRGMLQLRDDLKRYL